MTEPTPAPVPAGGFPNPRPGTVNAAFWLCVAAAVLAALALLSTLNNFEALRQRVLEQTDAQGQTLPADVAEGVFLTGVVIGVSSGALFAVGYTVCAVLLRRGVAWSRWGIAVLALLTITGIFNGLPSFLQFACMVAATALAFLEPSTEWLLAVRRGRRAASA
jgi:hypothetical protein